MSSINILGLDASSDCCSVALQYNGSIKEIYSKSIKERSQKLLIMIEQLITDISPDELTALAFAAGPGSLTGLKISSSIMQALNLVYKKPIIKISTLQAIALQAFEESNAKLIMPCIDAKMGQLYYGVYNFDGSTDDVLPKTIKEDALSYPEQIEILDNNILIVGDGANILQQKTQLHLNTTSKFIPTAIQSNAVAIVKLANYWYKKYGIISNDANPIYLRSYD